MGYVVQDHVLADVGLAGPQKKAALRHGNENHIRLRLLLRESDNELGGVC
jgi:hypothetical protein